MPVVKKGSRAQHKPSPAGDEGRRTDSAVRSSLRWSPASGEELAASLSSGEESSLCINTF